MVTGGRPLYSSENRRRTSSAAIMPRLPSSHPPFGTESRWLPSSSAFSEVARQRDPAIAGRIVMMLNGQTGQLRFETTRGP